MSHSFDPASASPYYRFVWVDLTGDADASLAESLDGAFDIHRVREPARVAAAICDRAPAFVCFEFDEPNAQGVDALTRVRREHPALPVLVIAGRNSMAVAMWALRLRVSGSADQAGAAARTVPQHPRARIDDPRRRDRTRATRAQRI